MQCPPLQGGTDSLTIKLQPQTPLHNNTPHRQPHNQATYNHKHLCTTIHPTDSLTIMLQPQTPLHNNTPHRQPHNNATTTNTFAQQYTPQTTPPETSRCT